jgi:hypothetical protein
MAVEQILDPFVSLLIAMRNLEEPTSQKRVNDGSKKDEGRNKVERFPPDPPRESSDDRRHLLLIEGEGFVRKRSRMILVTWGSFPLGPFGGLIPKMIYSEN